MSIVQDSFKFSKPVHDAIWDLSGIISKSPFWMHLSWLEIRQRYRRSVIGPFWLTITMGVYAFALVFIFGELLKVRDIIYAPWVTVGVIVWSLITNYLNESTTLLVSSKPIFLQGRFSYSVAAALCLAKNLLISLHHFPVALVVTFGYAGVSPSLHHLWLLVSIPLFVIVLLPLGFTLAIFAARLRDVPPMIAAILTMGFFVTPIFFMPDQLGELRFIADFNPATYLIALVREPLLGRTIETTTLLICVSFGVTAWALTFAVLVRFRSRIAYWI